MVSSSDTDMTLGHAERITEQALGDAVAAAAGVVVATLTTTNGSDRSRSEWVALAGACQSLVNTVTAAQDLAIAEAARREGTWCEDGTLGEQVHGRGVVTLDAADVVAPALGVSHNQAQRRVEQAVQLALGRAPVEADRGEVATENGLGGLHTAMADGDLDGYRAGVVAFELEEAPAEVADAVVAALTEHLAEDAPTMRRRVRRLLARISPDLLRQRAERARASTGLRRWVAEPGVDAWFGTFPSEEAATAWAAVDRLAHRYVADGVCSSVEQARGRALTDLVTGNATVDVQVVLTVPADACVGDAAARASSQAQSPDADGGFVTRSRQGASRPDRSEDLIEVQGARPSEPMFVRRAWLTGHLAGARARRGPAGRRSTTPGLPPAPASGRRAARAVRPEQRGAPRPRGCPGDHRLPARSRAGGTGPSPRRAVPLPRVRRGGEVLRPRPRPALADRRHHCHEPPLPLPTPPPRSSSPPGWVLRLGPDGTATWTDPVGASASTAPLNALDATVLRHEPTAEVASSDTSDGPAEVLAPWSALETRLELHLEHAPRHRRCTSAAALRTATHRPRARAPVHDQPPF